MGKKYIIELVDRYNSELKGIIVLGLTQEKQISVELIPKKSMTPYTEPEPHAEVTADAYQRGYENGFIAGHLKAEKSGQSFYEDGYQRGLNDAWEAARTLWNTAKRKEIFGYTVFSTALMTLTGQEAIEKIRQYEQEQDAKIKVGDEVIPRETEYDTMIVTRLWKDDYDSDCIDAIGFDGRISSFLVSRVSKTGKHYEIATVLEKMRGEQDG